MGTMAEQAVHDAGEEPARSVALVPPDEVVHLGMLQASTPDQLIEAATKIATPLKRLITERGLAKRIQGKEYVQCEGWTTMGAMLGVTPEEEAVEERACAACDEPDCGHTVFVATVGLYTLADHRRVGRASAECGSPDELDNDGTPTWADRPRYARRSMAITRATAKAFRLTFSWIVVLAGYAPTPAEEVPERGFERRASRPAPSTSQTITLTTPIPFGMYGPKRQGGALTVEQAGPAYFQKCLDRAQEPDKRKEWYRFCERALQLFEDVRGAAEAGLAEGARQVQRDHEGPDEPDDGGEAATVASSPAEVARGRILGLLADPAVPEKSKGIYGELYRGMGPEATLDELNRVITNLEAAKRKAATAK